MKTHHNFPTQPLAIAGMILIGIWAFTSFVMYAPNENEVNETHTLTVKSDNEAQTLSFDLLIIGKKADGEIFSKREKARNTPFAFDLPTGDFTIVIHRESEEGTLTGRLERKIDGKFKGSAEADYPITVLTTNKAGDYTASGL